MSLDLIMMTDAADKKKRKANPSHNSRKCNKIIYKNIL